MSRTLHPLLLLAVAPSVGCVATATHEQALGQLAAARATSEALESDLAACRAAEQAVGAARDAAEAEVRRLGEAFALADDQALQCGQQLQDAEQALAGFSSRLDESTAAGRACQAVLDETRRAFERNLGQSRDLAERLERLHAVEQEMNRLQTMHASLLRSLQGLIDAGQLEVRIDRGRLVLQLPQDVLFDSGRAELKPDGRSALARIATGLAEFADRRFQVEGHTDNVPIRNSRFASNWELSTARALAVVALLVGAGVDPRSLSAAGFGEYQPRADNTTEAGRRQNRRIEIVLVPDLNLFSDLLPRS